MLIELKKFKAQSILDLEYKERNYLKVWHSSDKLVSSDSGIDEAFKSIQQSIMTKIKNSASEHLVVETIIKHSMKIFEC